MTKLVNRAKMSTATTGTGTITLGTAEAGYQSFADAGVVDADVVRYVIEDGTDFEIGTGTFGSAGGTLTRTVSESSNADAALNLSGSAVVYVSATAEDIPPVLELYAENPSSPTAPSATGANAVAIGNAVQASGSNSLAFGLGAVASNSGAVAISQATASGNSSVAIGGTSLASATSALALGYGTDAVSDFSTAVGRNAQARATSANAFGRDSYAIGSQATAIGDSYASGIDSFAAAITNNTSTYGATGANSVAIGQQSRASGANGLALGRDTQATATQSVSVGRNTIAGGAFSAVFGTDSTASANYSTVIGHKGVSNTIGKIVFAGGFNFSVVVNVQQGLFILRSDTTDATPEALTTDNNTAGATNQIILPNNSAYAFHGTIVARQQASQGTACAAWKIEGLIRREGNAASTVLVNSATTVLDNTPGWGMALSADTTNGGLKIEVTGAAATNIRWVATCHTSEVTF